MKTELKITLAYLALGIVWIYFSDFAIFLLYKDAVKLNSAQTCKGCLYVLATGGLLYIMLSYYYRQLNERIRKVEVQNKQLQEIAWMQSHLVRAPLARLIGCVNLLDDETVLLSDHYELIDAVKKSAFELDEVIRDISKKAKDTQ